LLYKQNFPKPQNGGSVARHMYRLTTALQV